MAAPETALAPARIAAASLPATYDRAKQALAECYHIDECKDWADRAAALASYAKQAGDQTLYRLAQQIQLRAKRRCGELVQEFDGRGGDRSKSVDAPTSARPTQRDAAAAAGLSKNQEVQAVRIANVPKAEFEALVERDQPPTVTALAARGT